MSYLFLIAWSTLSVLIGYNLVLPIVLYIFYRLSPAGKDYSKVGEEESDYAIIVTAYEQTEPLSAVVTSILKLNYENYIVYVVADKCDVSNLYFGDAKVVLLRPEEHLQSNTRSHFYAINRFKRNHEYLTIIDCDNLVDSEYLNELNKVFSQGFGAVQGVRRAKNMDTVYACLDAVQDYYYHFYDREILFALGSSATVAGSGMAFRTELYRNCLGHLDITGAGFDKVLQIEVLKQKQRIAFAKRAIVYDEKTSRPDQLVKQRARWFNAWFRYVRLGLHLLKLSLVEKNWNQFLFALIALRPPLFLVIIASIMMLIGSLFVSSFFVYGWLIALVLFGFAGLIALVHSKAETKIYRALLGIPLFMYFQVLSLLKIRKANEISVATKHYHNNAIEEVK